MLRQTWEEIWKDALSDINIFNIIDQISKKSKHRVAFYLTELSGSRKISQEDFARRCGVDRQTVFRDMKHLIKAGLVESKRGYVPTERLPRWMEWLRQEKPNYFGMD